MRLGVGVGVGQRCVGVVVALFVIHDGIQLLYRYGC